MCNRGAGDDDLALWNDPVPNVHVEAIGHADYVEMHPQSQSFGIYCLKQWQFEKHIDVKGDATIFPARDASRDFGSHLAKKLGVSIELIYHP